MPDQQGNTGADAETVTDTSLHAYKDSRRQDIKGDAEKLIDSEDPKDLQASEIADPDEVQLPKKP